MIDGGSDESPESEPAASERIDEKLSQTDPNVAELASSCNQVHFRSRLFSLPKDLETPHLYEDAAVVDETAGRVAVADGVSSAIFSRQWAQIITQQLVSNPPVADEPAGFAAWLNGCRQTWRTGIDTSNLKFYQRAKMADGAFTTILWCEVIDVDREQGRTIRAYGLGDTCLFHVRAGSHLLAFPIQNASEFGLNPHALQSIDRYRNNSIPEFLATTFRCMPGDLLVLCTDAVAQWAFQCAEAGSPVDWSAYWNMNEADWQAEVLSLRDSASMRVDDCTLVLLQFEEPFVTPLESEQADSIQAQLIEDPVASDASATVPADELAPSSAEVSRSGAVLNDEAPAVND